MWQDLTAHLMEALAASTDTSITVGAESCPEDAVVVVMPGSGWADDISALAKLPLLRAVIIPYAGLMAKHTDRLRALLGERLGLEDGVALHNLHHNAPVTAEMAIGLLFAAAKQLIPADQRFRQHDWRHRGLPFAGSVVEPPMPMLILEGRTALILGLGAVGSRVATTCLSLGMSVIATKRSAGGSGALSEGGVELHPPDALHRLLPRAHVLFVCLPSTDETRALIGAKQLNMLPDQAIVINVGRGDVIEEQPLFQALHSGRLHGAGLDVWWKYPKTYEEASCTPPSACSFASLTNTVLSPHRGGGVGVAELEVLRMRRIGEMLTVAGREGLVHMPHRWNFEMGY